MQDPLNIRDRTGMTQENLATFLDMSRRSLTKVEKGICSLGTGKLIKLARLQVCLENLPAAQVKNELPIQAAQQQYIKQEKDCRYFILVLQRKLARREATYSQCMNFYKALCILQPQDEGDELWIQKMKKDTIKKLDRCGPVACMPLRKRVYLLTAEIDYISRFVNENQIQL
jgi:transcriptional regulator with XRE-family HTH domain